MKNFSLKPLPVRSRLEEFRTQAGDLIKAFKSGDQEVLRCIRQHHPRLPGRANTNDRNAVSNAQIRKTGVTVADAQTIVARWHGFESWQRLEKHIRALSQKGARVLPFELAVEAIIHGDAATVRSLLRNHPDLARRRSTREHRATLLHYVGANGVEAYRQKTPRNAVEIARILIRAGSEVDADLDYGPKGRTIYPERRGSTTLGMVATSYHPAKEGVQTALLKALVDAGASVNGLKDGWSPLLAALHNGRGKAAAFLARHGARMDLEGAAGVGRFDGVKNFFKNGHLKANATQVQMKAGFMWACEYGQTKVVDFLLRQGMNVSVQPHGETGLHWAAYSGHAPIVKLLLRRKAPINLKDRSHAGTPLGWAIYGWCNRPPEAKADSYPLVVALLVRAGAEVEPGWLADRGLGEKLRAEPSMLAALRGEA